MSKATLNSMSRGERDLIGATDAGNLRTLDEEALIALHGRVRRARDKHVQLHRREVAAQVAVKGGRGMASAPPRRSASKAEVFEAALARVSTALARSARESAAELRAARLATAKRTASGGARRTATRATTSAADASKNSAGSRSRGRRPVERKSVASARASGARRQAKRDAR
jgi:hypothetical protein